MYIRTQRALAVGVSVGRVGQTMDQKIISKSVKTHIEIGQDMVCAWLNASVNTRELNIDIVKVRLIKYYEYIYKFFLVQNSSDESWKSMKGADDELLKMSAEIYEELGNIRFSKKIPVRYIKYWRRNKDSNVLKIILKLYHIFR